ncbi:protein farnesyltransferase subunit beta-like [Phragmites australis]|uniref:protein farnesyltransferase subunit beta-like n=1 Tax=Phragmites australis TaxID=29695 RepID=UPI002D76DF9B|nr:protein farnesyltransferase subunit beta-like [Phragmites australis]
MVPSFARVRPQQARAQPSSGGPPPTPPPAASPMESSQPPAPPTGGDPAADHEAAELPRLTVTQVEQMKVEANVADFYRALFGATPNTKSLLLELWRDQHIEYLTKGLRHLGPNFHVLDANRPWLCYWMVHPLALLDEVLDDDLEDDIVDFLARCQDKDGGYGGGPGQLPHLATTYAAVNTLVTIGSERALSSINRNNLHKFMVRVKDTSGAFRMHEGGEIDVRACYTAVSVASLVNILDDELAKGVGDYIARCQTYEGGIAGEPYAEAHGGYTFCGLAALILLNETKKLDLPSLIDWVAFRQGVECGFQGRTNKLVDGCYSFWQGAAVALTQKLMMIVDEQLNSSCSSKRPSGKDACGTSSSGKPSEKSSTADFAKFGFDFIMQSNQIGPLFHNIALQQYILVCAQVLEGGLRDKPGKNRDYYHSCYCLSGLSVSQYSATTDSNLCPLPQHVLGPYSNLLEPIHPLYNVVLDKYHTAYEFFSKSDQM